MTREINEHGQNTQVAILLLQLRWIKKYKRHHFRSICDKLLELASTPCIKRSADGGRYSNKEGENPTDKRATLICDKLEVASNPRIKRTADLDGYAKKEGENEDDKWITVTGKSKHKNLLKPKLKPTLHNAFAILSQPDDPTNYKMSGPTLKMDDDKTILPPDPREHSRQQKIARRQHIKQTLRRLRDSDNLFLDDSITLAEDKRTSLAKADETIKIPMAINAAHTS